MAAVVRQNGQDKIILVCLHYFISTPKTIQNVSFDLNQQVAILSMQTKFIFQQKLFLIL